MTQRLARFPFLVSHIYHKLDDYDLDFVLLDAMRRDTTFLLEVDERRGRGEEAGGSDTVVEKFQGVPAFSCPCVTSDEDGDRAVSLLKAAVSSS